MENTPNIIDEILKSIHKSDEECIERAKSPIVSEYQKRLIDYGWMPVVNEIATNYLIGCDCLSEPLKDSLRRMKDDFEKRFCHNKKVEFFRAYNIFGTRIPHSLKNKFWKEFENSAVVAIYVKDGE